MVNVQKFPFQYVIKAPSNGGTSEFRIDTPWLDLEGDNWQNHMERDVIHEEEGLKIIEQKYDNNFHIMFIQSPDKIVIKSNWKLDYSEKEDIYYPRIQ